MSSPLSEGGGKVSAVKKQLDDLRRKVDNNLKGAKGGQDVAEPPKGPPAAAPAPAVPKGKPVMAGANGAGVASCKGFQFGKCGTKGKSCDKGLRKFSGLLPNSTKPCGMTNHGAEKCKRCQRQ